jgi:hypothetical protein
VKIRQADVQRHACHARQRLGVGVQHAAGFAEVVARVQHQDHLLAQEGEGGAVLPFDARRFQPLAALARLLQLVDDPARLAAHGRLDFADADPARRADHQALGADGKADVLALAAPELVAHQHLAQEDLAIGVRMPKGVRRQHLLQAFGRGRGRIRRGCGDHRDGRGRTGGFRLVEQVEEELKRRLHGPRF